MSAGSTVSFGEKLKIFLGRVTSPRSYKAPQASDIDRAKSGATDNEKYFSNLNGLGSPGRSRASAPQISSGAVAGRGDDVEEAMRRSSAIGIWVEEKFGEQNFRVII